MLKHRRLSLFLLVLATLIIVAAGVSWVRLGSGAEGMVKGILDGRPCAPPCWQGITPGMSMDGEALVRRLRRMPGVKTVWENGPCVMWLWYGREGYNSICMDRNDVVESILLSVDFDLTVGEIIDEYGTPKAVNAVHGGIPEHPYIALNLLYPACGMWVRAKVLPDYEPVLEPTTQVYEVLYLIPSDSLEAWLGPEMSELHLQPWPGYGPLDEEIYDLP